MSFTNTVKNEVVKVPLSKLEQISLLSALLTNTMDTYDDHKVITESAVVAKFIFTLIKDMYSSYIKVSVRKGYNYNKNYIYILDITNNFSIISEDLSLNKIIPDSYLIDDIDLKKAYLRGVFISSGSISDPKKSRYHLEFVFNSLEYAMFINDMLNSFDLNSKYLKRDNRYMVYIKESEKIGDFLRIIKATNALLYYENIRILRNEKNILNRINNCEQANVDKIIQTAANQIEYINYIKTNDAFDMLDEKLKDVCNYRLNYPEVSLSELSNIMSLETQSKITKSGLHHRFNKIKLIAMKLKEKNNQQ